jgi:hypothetical protein
MKFNNINIDVDLEVLNINGELSGTPDNWEFRSNDPVFVRLCAKQRMYSHSYYGNNRETQFHRLLQNAIAKKVRELTRGN